MEYYSIFKNILFHITTLISEHFLLNQRSQAEVSIDARLHFYETVGITYLPCHKAQIYKDAM